MRIILWCSILLLTGCTTAYSQSLTLEPLSRFNKQLAETSGLISWQQGFISHNDSGHHAALFILTIDGEIIDQRPVAADHNDWEDIAVRGNTVYLADIGNNHGRRRDLSILPLTLHQNEQSHFKPPPHQHNFDAEALTWVDDELWLLTKRWLDQKTTLYKVPTTANTRPLKAWQQLNPKMLVTGAEFDKQTSTLLLLGYSRSWWHRKAWVWLYPVKNGRVLEHQGKRLQLSENGQFEGITLGQDGFIYVTREGNSTNLFRSHLSLTDILEEK
ncbi:hypothetical protein [Oceanisphaera pacifica]|uniref:Phytase-like domain-containing protein n=1 Tax=Oceanisphaera pacifica TaxID=2818389 RepID=A0ABS3NI55_9GAMM|nr:hypothetical protein [Oceanisphaera pacifica]MBO1520210.1 hypothetical protein [Oceanisphaera pacifica]